MTTALDERIRQLFDGVAPVTADEARKLALGRVPQEPRRLTRKVVVIGACLATLAGVLVAVTAQSPARHRGGTVTTTTVPGNLYTESFDSPTLTVTSSGAYLSWLTSPPVKTARSALARVDLSSGRLLALRDLGAATVDKVLAAGSWLWVTVTTSSQPGEEQLLRLDPSTLQVLRRQRVGSGGFVGDNIAVAGGGLWVDGGNKLLRFSLSSGNLLRTVSLPGASSSTVAADAAGSALVVGEASSSGIGTVESLDPVTGAPLSAARRQAGSAKRTVFGIAAPRAAVSGASVWLTEATGMLGYVQRLVLPSLHPAGPSCAGGRSTPSCVEGTNGISAVIEASRLFVTDPVGGTARNYCADPSDGHVLARLRLPQPQQDRFLLASAGVVYYAAPAPRSGQFVERQALPRSCSAG